jgi:uncharacterized protein (DUF952 family)
MKNRRLTLLILHIAKAGDWKEALVKGEYETGSLKSDEFIHCSLPEQIIDIANSNFRNEKGLVLLCIDSSKVKAEIKLECGGLQDYPHIYGKLNLDAVIKTFPFEPDCNGNFTLPQEIKEIASILNKEAI